MRTIRWIWQICFVMILCDIVAGQEIYKYNLNKIDNRVYEVVYEGQGRVGFARYEEREGREPYWRILISRDGSNYVSFYSLSDWSVLYKEQNLGTAKSLDEAFVLSVNYWFGEKRQQEGNFNQRVQMEEVVSAINIRVIDHMGNPIPQARGIWTWYITRQSTGYVESQEFTADSDGAAEIRLRPYKVFMVSVWGPSDDYIPFQSERTNLDKYTWIIGLKRVM